MTFYHYPLTLFLAGSKKIKNRQGGSIWPPLYVYVPGAQTACRMHLQYFFIYEGYNYEDISPTIETIYPYSTKKKIIRTKRNLSKVMKKWHFQIFLFLRFFLPMALLKSFHLIVLQFSRYLKNIIKDMHIDFCAEILINKKVIAVLLTKSSDKKREKNVKISYYKNINFKIETRVIAQMKRFLTLIKSYIRTICQKLIFNPLFGQKIPKMDIFTSKIMKIPNFQTSVTEKVLIRILRHFLQC